MRGRSPCASPPSMCTCLVGFLQCGKTATLLQQTLPSTCTHTLCRTHACMHAHLHTHTRAYIHTYTHTHTHTHTHTPMHVHSCTWRTHNDPVLWSVLEHQGRLAFKKGVHTHTHSRMCAIISPTADTYPRTRVFIDTKTHSHLHAPKNTSL